MKFSHWSVAPGITAVLNPGVLYGPGTLGGYGRSLSYLIEGAEQALLMDTGFGIANLKKQIELLTDLPLIVINSHVHPDHSGGNAQFPFVYVSQKEVPDMKPVYFPEDAFPQPQCEEVKKAQGYKFTALNSSEKIDLGGRTLQVVEIPGHTAGSIALLDSRTRILLSGDALLKRVLLFGDVPIRVYREALESLREREISDIFSAHWPEALGAEHINRMIHLLTEFDPDKVEKAPWKPFGTMCVYRQGNRFEEPEFCAIGYPQDRLNDLLK